jgi:hypothetical protein
VKLRLLAFPLVALLSAGPLLLALANHIDVQDPNDVDGRLDLRKIAVYGRPRVWNLMTYNAWRNRSIWDRGYVLVQLDTLVGKRFDYYALVLSNGKGMRAFLYRDRAHKPDYRVAWLPAWRTSRRGVKVRIPLKSKAKVSKGRGFFRWKARTLFTGGSCPRTCVDVAPVKAVKEPLLGPQPSPSPSSE